MDSDLWGQENEDDDDGLLVQGQETNKGDEFEDDDDSDGDDMDIDGNNGKGNTPQGGDDGSGDLTDQQKLQLAERANEIYRQQLKYMQDHLASLRALIQDKENIIENLMLRYDLGIISQDQNKNGNVNSDDIDHEELRRKAEALAQRTILENFELREMVNELRDENFHLRNEIYELQDKINRQVLQINKLEKQVEQQAQQIESQQQAQQNKEDDAMKEPDPAVENQMGRRQSKTWDHPANAPDARKKRLEREEKRHAKKESLYGNKEIFGANESDSGDDNDSDSDDEKEKSREIPAQYATEEAKQKHEARANHTRKESVKAPNMFGSQPLEVDSSDEDIKQKRAERAQKERRESIKTPDVFGQNNNSDSDNENQDKARDSNDENEEQVAIEEQKNSEEANEKRKKRKIKHQKKESIVYQELFLNKQERANFGDDSLDALKKRKEQRRKSKQILAKHVGAKGHLSDEDVNDPKFSKKDKPRRYDYDMKKEKRKAARAVDSDISGAGHAKRASLSGAAAMGASDNNDTHHRRDSSVPVVNLGFEDPDVLLHFEQLKVKDLEQQLSKRNDEYDIQSAQLKELQERIKNLENENENNLNNNNIKNENIIIKLREENKEQQRVNEQNSAQLMEVKTKNKTLNTELSTQKNALQDAISTKASLASRCSSEIMRLSAIINQLLEIPTINESVQLLINESFKSKTYQMSQQD